MDPQWKIVLVGSCGVGKSSLLQRFATGSFPTELDKTSGVSFRIKKYQVRDNNFKLLIWDTPGKDSFDVDLSSVYRNAHVVFICFNLCDSFGDVSNWLTDVSGYSDAVRYLVGCKGDAVHQVPEIAAVNLAAKYGCEYFEVSAKSGRNVEHLFSSALVKIYDIFTDKSKQFQLAGASSLFNQSTINGTYVANQPASSSERITYHHINSLSTELVYKNNHWVLKKKNRVLAFVPSPTFMLPSDPALQGQWSENAGAYFFRPFSQPLLTCSLLEGVVPVVQKEDFVPIENEPLVSTDSKQAGSDLA